MVEVFVVVGCEAAITSEELTVAEGCGFVP